MPDPLTMLEGLDLVADFLNSTLDSYEKADGLRRAIAGWLPWAKTSVDVAYGSAASLKLFSSIASAWTAERDPNQLVATACAIAYARAAELSVAGLPPSAKTIHQSVGTWRAPVSTNALYDFSAESITTIHSHQFFKDADSLAHRALSELALDSTFTTRVISGIRARLSGQLRKLLTVETAARFQAVTRLLEFPADKLTLARQTLQSHADVQRARYEEYELLPGEPYSLASVYERTDCGLVSWAEVRPRADDSQKRRWPARSPFAETVGGRHDLLTATVDLLADPEFGDAIVIQGTAGAGKSSFTLRLATELMDQGLVPIRVRMRDISIEKEIREAIGQAINTALAADAQVAGRASLSRCNDGDMLPEDLLRESVPFRNRQICPYVLILDGWDELVISSSSDYRSRVERFLERVRRDIIRPHAGSVRVILTGRPSNDVVAENGFLTDETILLTMRPFTSEQLERYARRLAWTLDDVEAEWRCDGQATRAAVERYAKAKEHEDDVLAYPLLAFIALRVLAEYGTREGDLTENQALLLRRLVDMTVGKAGKHHQAEFDEGAPKYRGEELRRLLRITASSMTIAGVESISERELDRRCLLWNRYTTSPSTPHAYRRAEQSTTLARLMISFYFRSGAEGALEFAHKSFREYLFVEEMLETLKELSTVAVPAGVLGVTLGDERADTIVNRLLRLWCQINSTESWPLAESLLTAEVARAFGPDDPSKKDTWRHIRDFTARMWQWMHQGSLDLRRTRHDDLGNSVESIPLTWSLSQWCNVDSDRAIRHAHAPQHVSMAIHVWAFQISMTLHHLIARWDVPGWGSSATPLELRPERWQVRPSPVRTCQTVVDTSGGSVVLFAPGGYLEERAIWGFESISHYSAIRSCDLRRCAFDGAELEWCLLDNAHISSGAVRTTLISSRAHGLRIFGVPELLARDSDLSLVSIGCHRMIALRCNMHLASIHLPLDGEYRAVLCASHTVQCWPVALGIPHPASYDASERVGVTMEDWRSLAAAHRRLLTNTPSLSAMLRRIADVHAARTERRARTTAL